ncbi:MAG TPA: hypothetical protein VLH87_03170 [Pyrinomonadaceae bacterium]|nr:hypothetical protein [Pyrinomonadaceae bacterium]
MLKSRITDAQSLIRFHETLLFLRAYPPSPRILNQVEEILKTFAQRVSQLQAAGVDLSPLDDPEVSGIAGTTVTSNFSYYLVRWLIKKSPSRLRIDWDWLEEEDRFGATMRLFLPLLEEDAMVEAHVPYHEWLRAAKSRNDELAWIIERFESLDRKPARYTDRSELRIRPEKQKAELYDSLKLHVRWDFGFRASRTGMKLPARKIFFHDKPLIKRRDVSLIAEFGSPPIAAQKLSRAEGERILDMARETSAVRYRELHGFTCGDSRRMLKANLGRGVDIFVMGVPPQHRLPLRAYHAALVFKNGVPVAYFEGLSVFERMESGFNLYYTFREGETAWLFSRILCLMRQLLGVTVFSIDPYQIGHENEEGIESGAFWFYRKLGFRPVLPELMKLALAEERKIAANARYRTPARMLRKLAAGHMLFERPPAVHASARMSHSRAANEWDRFQVRNVGLAVQRRMATDFDGHANRIQRASLDYVARALGISPKTWSLSELQTLNNLSLVLAMIPGMNRWSGEHKRLAASIIRAKGGNDERQYLRLMQTHEPLREAIIKLGSA